MWARRLGLTFEETMHAFGIAEYYGPRSPVMRVMDNPTMLKDGSGVGCWAGMDKYIEIWNLDHERKLV